MHQAEHGNIAKTIADKMTNDQTSAELVIIIDRVISVATLVMLANGHQWKTRASGRQ